MVADDGEIRMIAEAARWHLRRRSSSDQCSHRLILGCADGNENDRACVGNGGQALGDHLLGYLFERGEEASVVETRGLVEETDVCAALDRCARLVEADVTVAADPEDLYT